MNRNDVQQTTINGMVDLHNKKRYVETNEVKDLFECRCGVYGAFYLGIDEKAYGNLWNF